MVPDEVVLVHTADGWVEPMRHYSGNGRPVVLVHGMAANHYNFDYREEISLADALRDDGWDVWVVSLRGDPGTVAPDRRARRSIDFDAFAESDLPAAIDEVLARTGADQVYWVGHSLGGMLLYATLTRDPGRVAAGVAIASPVAFDGQRDRPVLKAMAAVMGPRGRLWTRSAGKVSAALAFAEESRHPLGRYNPEFRRVSQPDNLDWPTAYGLARHALADVPKPLAHQALAWVDQDALVAVDGRPWVTPADVPILVLGGPADRVVPMGDVRAACAVFPDCAFVELSVAAGFSADYGHADPTIGRNARAEVYPVILDYLDAH